VKLEISPLSDALGAEVRGVAVGESLAEADRATLLEAWKQRHLLLFRDQQLDEEEQIRFVGNFGPLADESLPGAGGASYVSNVRPDGFARDGELYFHSDLAFTPNPLQVISMYALELPASGTSTRFANAVLAARTLPAKLHQRAAGLQARHVFDLVSQRQDVHYRLADYPEAIHAVHPVIWEHPRTPLPSRAHLRARLAAR
jgi:taurine dioxygenase